MRPLTRLAAMLAALATILALGAMPAAAGNFAEVTMSPIDGGPPVAGEERELRFILMQHGVTPVDHGQVQLTATLDGSDEVVTVPAASLGNGEWAANLALPIEGEWQLRVTHSVFETSPPTTIVIGPAGFVAPAAMPAIIGIALVAVAAIALVLVIDRRRRPERRAPAARATRVT